MPKVEVVDEVLDTSQTDNKVKYKITFEDGTEKIAQIDLYTPVTTAGTPQNKSLFDAIQEFLMTSSNPQTINVTATNPSSGASTQTATLTVAGRRYYFFAMPFRDCMFGLFDAQSGKFALASYLGRSPDSEDHTFVTDSQQVTLYDRTSGGSSTLKVSASLSGTTLTVTLSKNAGSSNYGTPSGIITVYELGGFVF